jgi:hypothetical protein
MNSVEEAGYMDELESLRSQLEARGVTTVAELALEGGSQLTVVVSTEEEAKRAFSLALRPEGVFLLGFRGIFRLGDHVELVETISRLADRVVRQPDLAFDPGEFSFEPYPYQKWLDDGRRRASEELVESGWTPIPDAENEELWANFAYRFSFSMNLSGSQRPAIEEPTPFVTWSVSGMRDLYATDSEQFRSIEWRSRERMLQALVGLKDSFYHMIVLDLNHTGYYFDPNRVIHRGVNKWPVPFIPIHNYSLFTDKTFSFGLFGNPWEGSICVFGTALVERFIRNPPPCVGDLIRSSAHFNSG